MNTEQIHIAVAECLGYAMFSECDIGLGVHLCADVWPGQEAMGPCEVPNYPASLDACAEFEKTLTEEERIAYGAEILNTLYLGSGSRWALLTATALQRCEAYLHVKGKWTE